MKLHAIFTLCLLWIVACFCYAEAAASHLPGPRQFEFTGQEAGESIEAENAVDNSKKHLNISTITHQPTHNIIRNATILQVGNKPVKKIADASSDVKSPDAKTQESQQVSVVVEKELDTAAGGKGYSKHKGHKGNFKKSSGSKGGKGFHKSGGHKGGKKGSHGKKGGKGHFSKGGKKGSGHHHKSGHFGSHKAGKKGGKGHNHGKKGHHNKGKKSKGFKNVYHKEEFGKNSKFYDDSDSKKFHGKHDHHDTFFKGHKGGKSGGGSFKGGKQHDGSGKKGFFAKGSFHDGKGGHKGSSGKSGHFGHKSSFGKGGGSASKKGGGHGGGHGKGHGGHGGGHGGHGKGGHGGHGGGHGGHGGGGYGH